MKRALDSLLAQDFEDFELIVSDNASTDDTRLICEAYAGRDKRIRYFRNEANIGVSPNHNRVFALSRGKYFAWSAHDLEYLPGMLSRCVTLMTQAPPTVVLMHPLCELVDDEGKPVVDHQTSIASSDPRPHRRLEMVIRHIVFVTQHYGLIVSEALKKTRLNGSYASSDYVLTAELAMLGEIREIPEVLIRRVIDSKSGTAAVLHSQKAWAAWLDPKTKQRPALLPLRERLAFEYFRSAWRLPLTPADKLACMVAGPAAHYGRILSKKAGPWRWRLKRWSGRLRTVLFFWWPTRPQ